MDMLDVKFIRENPSLVRKSLDNRGMDVKLVDEFLKLDAEWRKLRGEIDALRHEHNKISHEINKAKKTGKNVKPLLQKAKQLPEQIKKADEKSQKLQKKLGELLIKIPNMLHEKVPIGKDASNNVEIRKWGKIPDIKFKILNHAELIEKAGLADFDAGRKNAGQGFNYLLGEMALLDQALQRYGVDFMLKKGYQLVMPPMMLNFNTFLGAANGLQVFEEVVYKIEKEDLYVIGTAEHPLVALYRNKTLNKKELPIKICALTPCFRKEIGGHGVDTKGLFRMHQFNKVEQVVFCKPEKSFEMLEEMQKLTEEFFQNLKLPYRVVEICSGDLGPKFAKQYDIEAWFPRQTKYAEITSAGNCTDFQARHLNIKYQEEGKAGYVHILNNTMVATSRAMVAILENCQNKDGTVNIPRVLWPYMHGVKKIGKKK